MQYTLTDAVRQKKAETAHRQTIEERVTFNRCTLLSIRWTARQTLSVTFSTRSALKNGTETFDKG